MLALLWGLFLGLAVGAVVRAREKGERERGTPQHMPPPLRVGGAFQGASRPPRPCPTAGSSTTTVTALGLATHRGQAWAMRPVPSLRTRAHRSVDQRWRGAHFPLRPSRAHLSLSLSLLFHSSSPPPSAPTWAARPTCPAWTSAWTAMRPCPCRTWAASPCRRGEREEEGGCTRPPAQPLGLHHSLFTPDAPLSLSLALSLLSLHTQLPPLPGLCPPVG